MPRSPLLGHDEQRTWFRRAMERNRLSHAYLFAGPAGIGKRRFAELLAQSLFCQTNPSEQLAPCGNCPNCKRFLSRNHPDYHSVGIPAGKREIPIAAMLGEEERRGREGLCHDLVLRPMAGDRKFALIDDAHALNRESGNALLKTLEEPPPKCVIILTTDQPEAILPTIRSRTQLVQFHSLSTDVVRKILLEEDHIADLAEAERLAALSDGSVSKAIVLRDGVFANVTQLVERHFGRAKINPLQTAKELTELLSSADGAEQRTQAVWVLRSLAEWYRSALRQSAGSQIPSDMVAGYVNQLGGTSEDRTDLISRLIERVCESERQLEESMQVAPCMEALVDDLARIHREALAVPAGRK